MGSAFDTSDNLFVSEELEEGPGFEELFGEEESEQTEDERFRTIDQVTEDPKPYFRNTSFYQEALTGEGEVARKLHATLAAFLKAETPEERSDHRNRLIPLYWELTRSIARKAYQDLPEPKKLLLRFGVLLPTMLDKEQRLMIAQVIERNGTGQPIHYVDEWLMKVARGEINVSATDETKGAGAAQGSRVSRQAEVAKGKVEAQLELIRTRNREMEAVERQLEQLVAQLIDRAPRPESDGQKGPYSDPQRAIFSDISTQLRRLSNQSRELTRAYNELVKYQDSYKELRAQAEAAGEDLETVDADAAVSEMGTIRQMVKLCVGRQGNHFPLFHKQYFRGGIIGMATRENVNNVLADVEYLDPGIFERTFKQKTTRIAPNVILVPCYGDFGVCWEPFERYNRATSRGRLAIPIYPKDLKAAVVASLGDLRWQVAKEKAAHYWMEEGLTGWYYQWFTEQKLKGDVKDQFIQDYILWITRESEGTQKLSREVRDIFWRYIPFPQEIKDQLRNRGFVYADLIKKDQNRAMSDGY